MKEFTDFLKAQPKWKIVMAAAIMLIFAIVLAGNDKQKSAPTQEAPSAPTQEAPTAPSTGLNQVLKTKYFDVTASGVYIARSIDSQLGYGNLEAEAGTKYLVIELMIKNTDGESRMAVDGKVLIDYQGKRLKYEKTEIIPGTGWGLSETMNPLMVVRTKVVYKIPEEIVGEVYYRPGRAAEGELIHLGNI